MNSWSTTWSVLIIIFVGGLVVGNLSEKPRIPDVAAYLVYGILIGPALLNWVNEPSQSQVNQFLLNLGATLILFDGGRSIELSVLRKVWVSVTMLVTVGVFITAGVVGVATHLMLGTPWIFSLLVGSVIASTDPATLIPVFRRIPVLSKLRQTIESESAFNDATGAVLTFTLLGAAGTAGGHIHFWHSVFQFIQSAGIGLIVGCIFGTVATLLVSKSPLGIFHEYGSFVMLVTAISAYQVSTKLGASGFMAAFAAGIITGNGTVFGLSFASHTEDNIKHFGSAITLIMRMMIFVLLGTQVDFGLVSHYLAAGLIIVGTLMLISRPIAVFASVGIDKRAAWNAREKLFMCWVRETGVIPAALAGMLVAHHFPRADVISSITFMAILLTIVIQASTTGLVAKRLGVTVEGFEQEEI